MHDEEPRKGSRNTFSTKYGTRVLPMQGGLWYRSAIVFLAWRRHHDVVWARFVLLSSAVMRFRFGTLLTRSYRHKSVDGSRSKSLREWKT